MREQGFYWLRSKDKWSIGEWRRGEWWIIANDGWFEDSDFDEIDEHRIERTITIKGSDIVAVIERHNKRN